MKRNYIVYIFKTGQVYIISLPFDFLSLLIVFLIVLSFYPWCTCCCSLDTWAGVVTRPNWERTQQVCNMTCILWLCWYRFMYEGLAWSESVFTWKWPSPVIDIYKRKSIHSRLFLRSISELRCVFLFGQNCSCTSRKDEEEDEIDKVYVGKELTCLESLSWTKLFIFLKHTRSWHSYDEALLISQDLFIQLP